MAIFPVASFNHLQHFLKKKKQTKLNIYLKKRKKKKRVWFHPGKVHTPPCKSGRAFWLHTVVSEDSISEPPNTYYPDMDNLTILMKFSEIQPLSKS